MSEPLRLHLGILGHSAEGAAECFRAVCQAGSAELARRRGIRLRKGLKQTLALLLVDADAGVFHGERHAGAAAT